MCFYLFLLVIYTWIVGLSCEALSAVDVSQRLVHFVANLLRIFNYQVEHFGLQQLWIYESRSTMCLDILLTVSYLENTVFAANYAVVKIKGRRSHFCTNATWAKSEF